MATIKELKEELKAKGIKGITGKKKAELMAMLAKHGGGEKSPSTPKTACSCHDKKPKAPYVAKLPKMTQGGKKIPKMAETPVDKQIKTPKKITGTMQEELAKAGLRGGLKKKYKV
jgi:hypothetical protein